MRYIRIARRSASATALLLLALTNPVRAQDAAPHDPALDLRWLGTPRTEPTPHWSEQQTMRSMAQLRRDPRFAEFERIGETLFKGKTDGDTIGAWAGDVFAGEHVFHIVQDAEHPRGLWRVADLAAYRSARVPWKTLIDIDALAKAEGRAWRFDSATCDASGDRCLIALYEKDSNDQTSREFDIRSGRFVENGFTLVGGYHPNAVYWKDRDSLYVLAPKRSNEAWDGRLGVGEGVSLRLWSRNQPITAAKEILTTSVPKSTLGAKKLASADGNDILYVVEFTPVVYSDKQDTSGRIAQYLISSDNKVTPISPKIDTYQVLGVAHGRLIYSTASDHVCATLLDRVRDPLLPCEKLWEPHDGQILQQTAINKTGMFIQYSQGGVGSLVQAKRMGSAWETRPVAVPDNGTINLFRYYDPKAASLFASYESLLDPQTILEVDTATLKVKTVREGKRVFDSSNLLVERLNARSQDGALVPYLLVRRKDLIPNGDTPTIVTGYPNAPVEEPHYLGSAGTGSLWLERGGAYAYATKIRGHGLVGAERQRGYEDIVAVADDLTARRISRPERLGLQGFSMGGLMVGVVFNQYRKHFNAFVTENGVMNILTRHSEQVWWGTLEDGRYGDYADPANRRYLERTSPVQNLSPSDGAPPVFVATNTGDDDVAAALPRIYAARMEQLGMPFYFSETANGGHGPCTPASCASYYAALYTYFSRQLMDTPPTSDPDRRTAAPQ